MRARDPDTAGAVAPCGVRVPYEVFGAGEPTVLMLPSWQVVHAEQWRMQVPFLARRFRTVVLEGPGNGGGERTTDPAAYADDAYHAAALAVLDELGVQRAVVTGVSAGGRRALQFAARHPGRVHGIVAIGPLLTLQFPTSDDPDVPHPLSPAHWQRDHAGFARFFAELLLSEPHSTKAFEDVVRWTLETSPEILTATVPAVVEVTEQEMERTARAVQCPVLLLHGDVDRLVPHEHGEQLAAWSGAEMVTVSGGGHLPHVRDPVRTNLLIDGFVSRFAPRRPAPPARRWTRALARRPRVLVVTSPIGLGHARRDVAIAAALRELRPDVEIDWLTGPPVTGMLAGLGERVHPASALLASESAHVEDCAGEHDLHAFRAVRDMDAIMAANFHVFHDVVESGLHDLVVADEGWEVDHFLHENPELKRAPLAWLTDFVGWLPMPGGGAEEAALTADHNAEMVEHVARYPRLRDRSIFVGDPDDLVAEPLGPGLPSVSEWTARHFAFAGYVTGGPPPDRELARHELGYRDGETVCVVTAGGTAVGRAFLTRVLAAQHTLAASDPGTADGRRDRPPHRPRIAAVRAGGRAARVPAGPAAPSRGVRHRVGAGRADHHDGARRRGPSVPVLPARPAFRAADPRRAPAAPTPGGPADGVRRRRPGRAGRRAARRAGPARRLPAGAHRRRHQGRRDAVGAVLIRCASAQWIRRGAPARPATGTGGGGRPVARPGEFRRRVAHLLALSIFYRPHDVGESFECPERERRGVGMTSTADSPARHDTTRRAQIDFLESTILDDGVRVLCLDVFDTVLWRRVPRPTDVFPLLAGLLRESGDIPEWITDATFRAMRITAERRARDRREETDPPVREVSLAEIWREMPISVVPGPERERMLAEEVELERRLTVVDHDLARIASLARERGVPVCLVSDTYFSDSQLRYLLDRPELAALRDARLFRSQSHGVAKTCGLWDVVLRELDVPAGQVVHVGDDADADHRVPASEGVRTVPYPRIDDGFRAVLDRERESLDSFGRYGPDLDPIHGDHGLTTVRGKVLASCPEEGTRAGAWRYGAGVIGPVLTGFSEWAVRRAADLGASVVWCPMREGEQLSWMLSEAAQAHGLDVVARPVWLSRQSTSLASLDAADPDALRAFLRRGYGVRVRDLLELLAFRPGDVPALAEHLDAGLDHDTVVDLVADELTGTPHLRHRLARATVAARSRLVASLRRAGALGGGPLVLADLGWGGTIQLQVLEEMARPVDTLAVPTDGAARVAAMLTDLF